MAPWRKSMLFHICGADFSQRMGQRGWNCSRVPVIDSRPICLSSSQMCLRESPLPPRTRLGVVTQPPLSCMSPHHGVCCFSELVRELCAAPVLKDAVYCPPPFFSFSINLLQGRCCVQLWKTHRSFQSLGYIAAQSSDKIPNSGSAEGRIWKMKRQLEVCSLGGEQILRPWLYLFGIPLTHCLRKRAFAFTS